MIDFHINVGSDPGALPAEALYFAVAAGYRAVALLIRSDGHDLNSFGPFREHVRQCGIYANISAIAGIELSHIPPALLPDTVAKARAAGAELVLVHGESLAENVPTGTNFAAVRAGADILAHPGLVDEQVAAYAAEQGTAFEFCASPRHALCNAHVAALAARYQVPLIPGSAATRPKEILPASHWKQLYAGAALPSGQIQAIAEYSRRLFNKILLKSSQVSV